MWFQKISILPPQKRLEILGRRGSQRPAQKFKAMYEAKLEFLEGWGGGGHRANPFCGGGGGGVWIFSGTTHYHTQKERKIKFESRIELNHSIVGLCSQSAWVPQATNFCLWPTR